MYLLTECDIFKEKRLKSNLPLIDSILELHSILEKPDLKKIRQLTALLKSILFIYKSELIYQ